MRSQTLGSLIDGIDDIVDPMVGIVRSISETPRAPGAPDIFHFGARAANTKAFGLLPNFGFTGGASLNKERAIAKAIGEAIERYCAAIYDPAEMPLTSANAGTLACIDPELFEQYLPEQLALPGFPFERFDRRTMVRWTQTIALTTGHVAFAPAAFVWIPYQASPTDGEAVIGQSISTGLACHQTPERATLSGLYEVVERDAFTIFWQARLQPPRIRLSTIPESARSYIECYERIGDTVFLFNITTDLGLPSILSVLRSAAPSRPALVFAAATDIDPEQAMVRSLEELDSTRAFSAYTLRHMQAPSKDHDFANVIQQEHHVRLAAAHENLENFEFVFSSPRVIDFMEIQSPIRADGETDLTAVIRIISEAGMTPYAADLTSSDVRQLGLSVVRALIPGMHPLAVGHRIRARGNRRLYEVPRKLGCSNFDYCAPDNPFPHPYP